MVWLQTAGLATAALACWTLFAALAIGFWGGLAYVVFRIFKSVFLS